MYFTNKSLPTEIIEALKKADISFFRESKGSQKSIDLWVVYIPQLDRPYYEIFKKVLEEIHGEWDRSKGGHVFKCNPKEMIDKVVSVGCLPQRKPYEAFFTPKAVTELLIDWGSFHYSEDFSHWRYLEPQAGQGFILDVLCEKYLGIASVFDCCEIDEFNRSVLLEKGYRLVGQDFLTANLEPVYDYIIMNPPFNGRAGDYVGHIEKAFSLLAPKGELLAIVPAQSFLTSTVKRIEDFRNKVFTYGEHAELDDDAFKESGTNTKCCMIRMTKFSEEKVRELETEKTHYNTWDAYTGPVVVALQCEAEWDEPMQKLVALVREKRIDEKLFLQKLDSLCDLIVRQKIHKEEYSFRWDTVIRKKVVNYLFKSIVEDYFDDINPFVFSKPRQLSLFG